jgi:hypothetical protein
MLRLRFMAPLLVVGMFGSGFLIGDDKKPEKEQVVIIRRLPAYYSRIGLSQKQKNEIYRIRGKYETEIQGLYEKINELRDEEKTAYENVLTPDQLARLREILVGADRKKGGVAKDAEAKMEKKNTAGASKKKDTAAKATKKGAESKDKNAPVEIKK